MAHLLAYLVGLPDYGSPLVFPKCFQLIPLPKSIDGGPHPSLEGRGQVAASLGADGPKQNKKY